MHLHESELVVSVIIYSENEQDWPAWNSQTITHSVSDTEENWAYHCHSPVNVFIAYVTATTRFAPRTRHKHYAVYAGTTAPQPQAPLYVLIMLVL